MTALVRDPDFLHDNFLSTDRRYSGEPRRHQRLRAARQQCAARAHLGQFLLRDLQDVAGGRHDQRHRSVHRRGDALRDARRRARLPARAVAGEHLGVGAVSAQQLGRQVQRRSFGRRAHGGVSGCNRENALAGEAARPCFGLSHNARKAGSSFRRPHCPTFCSRCCGSTAFITPDGQAARLGPIPKGTPVNLLANLRLLAEGDSLRRSRRACRQADRAAVEGESKRSPRCRKTRPASRRPKPSGRLCRTCLRSAPARTSSPTADICSAPSLPDDDKRALIAFLKRL